MVQTSVPPIVFSATGLIAPTEAEILAGVQADQNLAFGGNINPSAKTPQGQLAVSTSAIIGDKNDQILAFQAAVDPAFSSGRFQDAIGRIYFLTRNPAEPTVTQATCTGLVGVVIPVGALALATDGNLYSCTSAGTIGSGGTVSLPFACSATGPIACPAGSLNVIYQAIPGWDSITNAADGVLGNTVESASEFEARRAASVALNARGTVQAIQANVLDVAGVLDAYVVENDSSSPVTIGNYTLVPNSIYVAAAGGSPQDIANAIWAKKPPGCAYNGNTTLTVQDTNPSYTTPYPSYQVTYEIPTPLDILFSIVLKNSALVPSNYVALVQAAIINAFSGGDGGPRARIGSQIFASRFYSTVAALGPWVQIVSILIGNVTPTLNDLTVGIAYVPVVSAADISVTLQ